MTKTKKKSIQAKFKILTCFSIRYEKQIRQVAVNTNSTSHWVLFLRPNAVISEARYMFAEILVVFEIHVVMSTLLRSE